jgi:inorganic pyrophosphatase
MSPDPRSSSTRTQLDIHFAFAWIGPSDDTVTSDIIDVVVEIASGTRNKYEFDEGSGRLRLERQLPRSVSYPADYGFVPGTLAEDGDALDALILIDEPVLPGCIVSVKLLGALLLSDEQGTDPKLITLLPEVAEDFGWQDIGDVPSRRLEEIEHFFSVYKDLEPARHVITHGYAARSEAMVLMADSRRRYAERTSSEP